MKQFQHIFRTAILMICICISISAASQGKAGNTVTFDRTVYDFGDVLLSDGALSCSFTMTNTSSKPVVIYSVTTSCGCTNVKWSREPILPGKTAKISASYTNDEGPYPFDKTLTVHISDVQKPVILRLRGISHEKKKSLAEMYPVRYGHLGFRSKELKCGNLERGNVKSDETRIANFSGVPAEVKFTDISEGLSLSVNPNPIPAGGVATMTFSVTGIEGIWGKNSYFATPVVNGEKAPEHITVNAFTKENFGGMTKAERDNAARPMFKASSYSFGKIRQGTKVKAQWEFSNSGKTELKIYKIDIDAEKASASGATVLKTGEKGTLTVELDTSTMPKGETLVIVTLTTNSPLRPIVNLFINGWLE